VQASWRNRPYGVLERLEVRAAHNGETVFFRLAWPDETRDDGITDTDAFTDAAAVLFPLNGDAPLQTMGSPEQPVAAWYWRPDLEGPLSVSAGGIGTTVRQQDSGLRARAAYGDGGWTLVIARALAPRQAGAISIAPGQAGKVAFAVWQGSRQERAGLKGVTLEWQPLEVEG
jgi:DMSO reductase family type II enzyme heme b subunit